MPFSFNLNDENNDLSQNRVLSMPVIDGDPSSPWRAVEYLNGFSQEFLYDCKTLVDFWLRPVHIWPDKKVFGTREILHTDYEILPNGRRLVKLTLSEYKWETYEQAEERISCLAAGIYDIIGSRDKSTIPIVIFSETRAEWFYAAQAVFRLNRPLATFYSTLGNDAIIHGLEETEASLIITSDELVSKVVLLCKSCPHVKYIVFLSNGVFFKPGMEIGDMSRFGETARTSVTEARNALPEGVQMFDVLEVEARGFQVIKDENFVSQDQTHVSGWLPPKSEQPTPDDIAVIMYTSGSTGQPKGVVMSHKNLNTLLASFHRRLPKSHAELEVHIAYLPLAHIMELVQEIFFLLLGISIGYSSPQTLMDNATRIKVGSCRGDIELLRPTIFTAVPKMLQRIENSVWQRINSMGPLMQEMFKFAYEYKRRRMYTGFPSFLVDLLIFRNVRSILGGRIRYISTGSAPISGELHLFINICFAPLIQGYGLTETCGGGSSTEYGDLRYGHIGAPLPGVQFRLREWSEGGYSPHDIPMPRGELLISGGLVCQGYFKQTELNKAAFFTDSDGIRWFCTGDIAAVHADGSFCIIDRKKDLVKLQMGEYVSLGKVELALSQSIFVDNICAYADPLYDFTVCLVSPNASQVKKLATSLGLMHYAEEAISKLPTNLLNEPSSVQAAQLEALCKLKPIQDSIFDDLKRVGQKHLVLFELPKKMYLDPKPWTPETGLVTQSFKVKRMNIKDHFRAVLNEMY